MTKATQGAGREVEQTANPGSANTNGKASATRAGGDPVNSPVKGNPGESDPAAGGYDYGLAAAPGSEAPAVVPTEAPTPVQVNVTQNSGAIVPGSKDDTTEYAYDIRARAKGEYDGLREKGDVFENTKNLPTWPEDPNSWFEDASNPVSDGAEKRRQRPAK
jgi:hypothetical protein